MVRTIRELLSSSPNTMCLCLARGALGALATADNPALEVDKLVASEVVGAPVDRAFVRALRSRLGAPSLVAAYERRRPVFALIARALRAEVC